jgi:hypothetical protein
LKYRVPHLWPTYIGERRTTFAKAYGIKVRRYLELFGKHVRTWELFAWAHRPPPPRKKKGGPFIPCASHWLHGNYIPKIGCHYFWPRLIALPKDSFPILVTHTAQGITLHYIRLEQVRTNTKG